MALEESVRITNTVLHQSAIPRKVNIHDDIPVVSVDGKTWKLKWSKQYLRPLEPCLAAGIFMDGTLVNMTVTLIFGRSNI